MPASTYADMFAAYATGVPVSSLLILVGDVRLISRRLRARRTTFQVELSMNLKSLQIFCDIVRLRSFSQAAEEHDMTQSAASQVVIHLEQRLKTRLIDRSKRPWSLTAEGDVYYRGVRKFIQQYDELESDVRSLHDEVEGRVRIAAIYSVGLSPMDRFLDEFKVLNPGANVQLQYLHPKKVYELVEGDAVDIGLVSYAKSTRTIEATPWREEPMALVCSPKHRFAKQDAISLPELDGTSFVGFEQGLRIRRVIDRSFASHGVSVSNEMEFDNIETIKAAIEVGRGVSLLPVPTIQRELKAGTLAAVPLRPNSDGTVLSRPLGIIRRRGIHLTRAARQFVNLLQSATPLRKPPTVDASGAAIDTTPGATTAP